MTVAASSLARILAPFLVVGLAGGSVGCSQAEPRDGSDSPAISPLHTYDPKDPDPNNGGLSMEQAGAIATDEYGGTITSVEGDDYKGEAVWKIELEGSSQGRIEVTVSKATGQILDAG